jgi:hypothetical protein
MATLPVLNTGNLWLGSSTPVMSVWEIVRECTPFAPNLGRHEAKPWRRVFEAITIVMSQTVSLPEAEDCQEALHTVMMRAYLYRPPQGSGLAVDEEGTYFDEC